LDNAPDKAKVGIIGSLGERRDGKAVKQITKLAQNADPAVATAAIRALARSAARTPPTAWASSNPRTN